MRTSFAPLALAVASVAACGTACCDPYPIQTTLILAPPDSRHVAPQPGGHSNATVTTTLHATAPITRFAVSADFGFDGASCNLLTCPKLTLALTPQGAEPKGPNDDVTSDGNPGAGTSHDTGACGPPCDKTLVIVVDVGNADTTAFGGTLTLSAGAAYETAKPGFCEPAPPPPRGDTLTFVVN